MSPVLVTDRARKDRSRTCRSMQNIRVSKSARSLRNTSLAQRRMMGVQCCVRQWNTARQTALGSYLLVNCQDWVAMRLRCLVKELIDCGINLYIQKEQLTLLDEEGHPSLLAPIMIATLSTCAQLERDNISFRLQSGRKRYIEKGGKLGRKVGSVKTEEQMKAEYREVISLLRKGYSIRDVAKLSGKGVSTVQRVKRLLKVQSLQ